MISTATMHEFGKKEEIKFSSFFVVQNVSLIYYLCEVGILNKGVYK